MGRLGIQPSEFWAMEYWEITAAIEGYGKRLEDYFNIERNVGFAAARYNAGWTANSEKASKKISKQKFDWEKGSKKPAMTKNQIVSVLKLASKGRK